MVSCRAVAVAVIGLALAETVCARKLASHVSVVSPENWENVLTTLLFATPVVGGLARPQPLRS